MKKSTTITLPLAGLEIPVYLVPAELLDGEFGKYEASEIFIRQNLASDVFMSTLIHECAHAVFDHYGLRYFILRSTDPEDDYEERIVSILSAALHQMLAEYLELPEGDD